MFKRSLLLAVMCLVAFGSSAYASRTRGPGISHNVAEAFSSVRYLDQFFGGEPSTVRVYGDGDTDLDLYVYDQFGNLMASDRGPSDHCVVTFYPRWTGNFQIVVRNLGPIYNRYTIETD